MGSDLYMESKYNENHLDEMRGRCIKCGWLISKDSHESWEHKCYMCGGKVRPLTDKDRKKR